MGCFLERSVMAKSRDAVKESKKKPAKTTKEKKAEKQAKKHAGDAKPLVAH